MSTIHNYPDYFLFSNFLVTFATDMNRVQTIKEYIINILIWLDAKLGGDSSTQTHAGNWRRKDNK